MNQPTHAEDTQPRPVWMEIHQEGAQTVIAVLAASDEPVRVTVELDVQGSSSLHTTSRAMIRPGRPPIVLSRASIDAVHPWKTRLSVAPEQGNNYIVERTDRD